MMFTVIHPKTLREVADSLGEDAVNFRTSDACRALLLATESYLNQSANRDPCDVASELEMLQRRISRVLVS